MYQVSQAVDIDRSEFDLQVMTKLCPVARAFYNVELKGIQCLLDASNWLGALVDREHQSTKRKWPFAYWEQPVQAL